jgi:hypothetical protein
VECQEQARQKSTGEKPRRLRKRKRLLAALDPRAHRLPQCVGEAVARDVGAGIHGAHRRHLRMGGGARAGRPRQRVSPSRAFATLSSDGVADPRTIGMPSFCARRTATSRAE